MYHFGHRRLPPTASAPLSQARKRRGRSALAYLQARLALEGAGLQQFAGSRGMGSRSSGRSPGVPRRSLGPWELVAGLLADGLAARGVDVTLSATLDSQTTATLDGVCPQGYEVDRSRDGPVWEALHVGHAFARSAAFDLVRNNLDWLPLAFSAHCRAPLVSTIHGFSDPRILPAYLAADSAYVSISNADRVPELDYCATVYHGIDLSRFAFSATQGDDLVILVGSLPTRAPPRPSRSPGAAGAGC